MSEFQAVADFSFQINKFVNIDLFQRGFYQIRLLLKLPNCKLPNKIEITNTTVKPFLNNVVSSSSSSSLNSCNSDSCNSQSTENNLSNIVLPPCVINGVAVSKTFQIVYKNEEVFLNDNVSFRLNICLDTNECLKQIKKNILLLQVELWFTDQEAISSQINSLACVSTRHLQIHFDLCRGVHYSLPVIFDYFHLSGITLSIHGSLITICQPYIYKNDSSLWLSNFGKGEIKEDKRSSLRNLNGESDKKANQYLLQVRKLHLTQWRLISVIVSAMLTMKRKINEYYQVLPPWQQARIKLESLFVDVSLGNLSNLSQECYKALDKNENLLNISTFFINFQNSFVNDYLYKDLCNVKLEDLLTSIECDLSYFCALTIDQWHRFLKLVSNSDRINQHLAKIHHFQRIKRFSEGFFCIEHPRSNLTAVADQSSNLLCEIGDLIRKSNYYLLLPPCEIECAYMDGDFNTLPIILELKYEPISIPKEESETCKETNSVLAINSFTTGFFTSPSKHSISSSSTSSSSSSKSHVRSLLSKLTYKVNEKSSKKELCFSKMIQDDKFLEGNTVDLLGLYSNGLLKDDENNSIEQVNRRIKLLNTFLNKKDIIKNYSKIGLDYSDKRLKKLAHENQSTLVHMLRNTISLDHSFSNIADLKRQSITQLNHTQNDTIENSRSWPNLAFSVKTFHQKPYCNKSQHRFPDSRNELKNGLSPTHTHSKSKKENNFKTKKLEKSFNSDLINTTSSLLSINNNFSKFQGTMYFPKPPKEFAMEGFDEPAEEVNLKPIPISIEISENSNEMYSNGISELTKLSDLKLNNEVLKVIENFGLKNSSSCHDLTNLKVEKTNIKPSDSQVKDDNFLKGAFGESKLTFLELLRSDHCLICSGSITNRLDQSWPCKCNRVYRKKKPTDLPPPSLRRISAVGSDLLSFLHAKEEFRNQILKKEKNILFYSDFHTLASRIPYFQCDPDFRAFNSHKELHLIVCVHGLDGNSADLRLVRTYLELGLPTNNFDFLMSQRNQGETFDSLETLTSRLINEIDNYVMTFNLSPTKLSFIGHSLGNIIIRSAISRHDFIRKWHSKLHTFLSLSGPHLGLSYNRSGLVNMGLWFIQKFKKAASLTQLSMKDSNNIRQTFLYQLSTKSGLENFRNILLCGSSQDYYVPIHSAHIELCNAALNDSTENGIAYREMASNIMAKLSSRANLNIVRYDVHHALSSNANSLIGRAAHIAVLDSELFIEKFMVVVGLKYFV